MWLHDDRNQIFTVGMGSSISVGEFSTCCAFLLGPGCLGRGRSQGNTEPKLPSSLFYQCEDPQKRCFPLQRNAALSSLSVYKSRQWLIKWLSNVTVKAAHQTCLTLLKAQLSVVFSTVLLSSFAIVSALMTRVVLVPLTSSTLHQWKTQWKSFEVEILSP